ILLITMKVFVSCEIWIIVYRIFPVILLDIFLSGFPIILQFPDIIIGTTPNVHQVYVTIWTIICIWVFCCSLLIISNVGLGSYFLASSQCSGEGKGCTTKAGIGHGTLLKHLRSR